MRNTPSSLQQSTAEGDPAVEQEEDGDSLDEAVSPTRFETAFMRNASPDIILN